MQRGSKSTRPHGNLFDLAKKGRWPTPQAYSHGPDSHPPGITKLDIEVRQMYPTPKGSPEHYGQPRANDRGDLQAVVMWPTPIGTNWKNRDTSGQHSDLRRQVGGQLNPTWVEWLMGFPLGWTDLGASGTPSCPRSPSTSGG
jgi:hypothetical protein